MPQTTQLQDSDIWGLIVIMTGLMLYRFSARPSAQPEIENSTNRDEPESTEPSTDSDFLADGIVENGLREPLLHGDI